MPRRPSPSFKEGTFGCYPCAKQGIFDNARHVWFCPSCGKALSRSVLHPEVGYWAFRLVKGGIEVPACILRVHTTAEPGEPTNLMERSAFLAAFIDGEPVSVDRVWLTRGRDITQAEYQRMVADREWCKKYAPHLPEANPRQRIDFNKIPAPF